MREARGNLLQMDGDVLVITTNGFVKANGQAVMGRGIAKAVADAIPNFASELGTLIRLSGNKVHHVMNHNNMALVTAPVKPARVIYDGTNVVAHAAYKFRHGNTVPGFWAKAVPERIVATCYELVGLVDVMGWQTILCPRFGCGAGELNWEDVKPMIENILDDRFICVTY